MSLLDDLIPYRDVWGFVHPDPGVFTQNGGRYTADAIAALWRLNQLPKTTRIALLSLMNSLERIPGVVMRTPNNIGGHQGPDDIVARICAYRLLQDNSFHYRFRLQSRIEATGWENDPESKNRSQANKWVWRLFSWVPWIKGYNHNNVEDNKFHVSTWFGRMGHIYAHNDFALDEKPKFWTRIWWTLAIGWSRMPKYKHEDKWTNSWHMVLIYNLSKVKYWHCSWAVRRWQKKMAKIYPQGVGQAFQAYWGAHPINQPLWGDFGDC